MSESTQPQFQLPSIFDNQNGWGPASDLVPDQFREIPYAPFSKGDKLGRVADWTNPEGQKQDNREQTRQNRTGFNRFNKEQPQAYGASFASAFAYFHNEDESSFAVVDNRSASTKKQAMKNTVAPRNARAQVTKQPSFRTVGQRPANQQNPKYPQQKRRYGFKDYDKPQRARNASINIGADWKVLDEIEFSRLAKLNFAIPQATEVESFGSVNVYNKSYDRVNTKNEKPLAHIERTKFDTMTSEDPIIQKYIQDNKATVFATDAVLSLLMCSTRTVYPWDIIVKKTSDGKVILDKRPGSAADFVTVNENTFEPPQESDKDTINSWSALCNEATYINQNFARQVLEKESIAFDKPNPFVNEGDASQLASCGYRYRSFNMSPVSDDENAQKIEMIVRTEVDAAVKTAQGTQYATIRALNEFDNTAQGSGGALPWKKSLDSQRGAVVATEMRNNAAKLARWAVQALLAGAEQLKLGYIARANPKENSRHVILGTQGYKPRDFANQMNLSLTNGWGIVKAVVDMCLQLPEGTYIMMKDPNRPILRVYLVPSDQDFEEENAESEEETEEK